MKKFLSILCCICMLCVFTTACDILNKPTSSSTENSNPNEEETNTQPPMNEYCTIMFDTQGGTKIDNIKVKKGDKIPAVSSPKKTQTKTEEYTFLYWEYKGDAWNFDNPVTMDMTLVAKYRVDKTTINF